jgi:uncharacterized protein YrrD
MTVLVRAGDLSGRPVVTLYGDRIAEVKDVVFDRGEGSIAGFTLNNPGLFSRSRKDALPWAGVHGIGSDAVMVRVAEVLAPLDVVAPKAERKHGDVLAGEVLTEAGQAIGTVVDVILAIGPGSAEVVGYEVEAASDLASAGRRVYVPLPATLSVSGEHLVVPVEVTEFVADDLAGFGAAVDAFRAKLVHGGRG